MNNLKLDDYLYSENFKPSLQISPVYSKNYTNKFDNTDRKRRYFYKKYGFYPYNDESLDYDDDESLDDSSTKENKFRLNRIKNKDSIKKILKNNIIYNNELDNIIWKKKRCRSCYNIVGDNQYYSYNEYCLKCEEDLEDRCMMCGSENTDGGICKWCRTEEF